MADFVLSDTKASALHWAIQDAYESAFAECARSLRETHRGRLAAARQPFEKFKQDAIAAAEPLLRYLERIHHSGSAAKLPPEFGEDEREHFDDGAEELAAMLTRHLEHEAAVLKDWCGYDLVAECYGRLGMREVPDWPDERRMEFLKQEIEENPRSRMVATFAVMDGHYAMGEREAAKIEEA